MTMRLLEHYASVQGEGPRTGVPTQFVRFAGCNLKCPGWPCDTPFAVDPKLYRPEQKLVSYSELTEQCKLMARETGAYNICLTGGEPLLQPRDDLMELIMALRRDGCTVEMFTNGSQPFIPELLNLISIVMDWKLPGSGEDMRRYESVRWENVGQLDMFSRSFKTNAIKFVCKDVQDVAAAMKEHGAFNVSDALVYYGAVWDGPLTTAELVKILLEKNPHKWRLNVQVHNYIWPANERAR